MKENSDLNKLFCEADRFVKIDKERRENGLLNGCTVCMRK